MMAAMPVDVTAQGQPSASPPDPAALSFDVASVKPNNAPGGGSLLPRRGSFGARNLPLRALICLGS
jgi:hypothetical protein